VRSVRLAALAGALALAGPLIPAGAQENAGRLNFAPGGASVGTPIVANARGLAPNARFALVWRSADPHWWTDAGKFYGILAPETARVLARGTSDAAGTLALHFTVPEDFGYMHDVEVRPENAATDTQPAATQGFTVVPHIALSPRSGPAGTPVTVTVTGLGYRFYQVVWHLLYDGAQTGWLSAVTTHGTARITLPASGEIGVHTLQAIEGPTAPYLNGQNSPNAQRYIPQVIADTFRITSGRAKLPPPAHAQTPRRVLPNAVAGITAPTLAVDYASGAVGNPIVLRGNGFAPQAAITLTWETYVGNRLSGNGWSTEEHPLAKATADANGAFALRFPTPDDLGGPHRVIARASGGAEAAAAYTIVPSVAEIVPHTVAPGGVYTVHVKGVGWTETANTYTMVLDNGDIGYACGFNSQGDVTIHLHAPGRTGTHYVDLYPTIYTGQINGPGAPPAGASVNGIYFLLPMLNAVDHPGEQLPAFHLAFEVR
jgi:hypothetical protein